MKGTIKILDGTGHTTVEYDTAVPASVEVATETIKRAIKSHMTVFDGTTKEQIKPTSRAPWDPSAQEETLVIPPMAGGA